MLNVASYRSGLHGHFDLRGMTIARPRLTHDPIVLSKLNTLGVAYPASRRHRAVLNEIGSDFTYAAELPKRGPFSKTWIALIRLSPDLEERFAINKEIPVIYSPHSDIQGRSIVRLPEMLDELPPDRRGFAGGVAFYWADDSRLQTKLEQFSKTEMVLLPLPEGTAEEFLGILISRLYSQDLYREKTAVTGDQFFGRRSILAQLRGDLTNHRVAAVFGTRKTGKTSILKELVATSSTHNNTGLDEVFVYLDLEHLPGPASGRDSIPLLLSDLSDSIRKELKRRELRVKELAELPESPSIQDFRKALTDILTHPSNIDLYLVIILDEIEHLCPPDANAIAATPANEEIPLFFGVLRKLVQELDNFNFMVAGLASAIVEAGELYGRHNPLFNIASAYYLSPFTPTESKELLQGIGARLGMAWTDGAIQAAHEETGGHVVLLRELAAQVWEATRQHSSDQISVESEDVESLISSYRRTVHSQIRETVEHVKRYYPAEYELCSQLMSDPADFNSLTELYPAEANRLMNLGLVTEEDNRWYPTKILQLGWFEPIRIPVTDSGARPPTQDLLKAGESRRLEFKASVRKPTKNEVAEIVVIEALVKAILGLLNADGGTVLAGVEDDGTVAGLAADIKHTNRSKDALLRFVTDKLSSYLGQAIVSAISVTWETVEEKDILVFDVPRSGKPVFPTRPVAQKVDLFVRQQANVVPLAGMQQHEYIQQRFLTN
jgi:hypothetical protein